MTTRSSDAVLTPDEIYEMTEREYKNLEVRLRNKACRDGIVVQKAKNSRYSTLFVIDNDSEAPDDLSLYQLKNYLYS